MFSDLFTIHFNDFMLYVCFSNNSNFYPQKLLSEYINLELGKFIIWWCHWRRSQHHNILSSSVSTFIPAINLDTDSNLWECGGHSRPTWFFFTLFGWIGAYQYGVYFKVQIHAVTYRIWVKLSRVFSKTQTVYSTSHFMHIWHSIRCLLCLGNDISRPTPCPNCGATYSDP